MKKITKHKSRFASVRQQKSFNLLGIAGDLYGPAPKWGLPELFVLVQFLSPALLFIPGSQSVRQIIRALPYLMSGFLLLYYFYHFFRQRQEKWREDSARLASEMDDVPVSQKKNIRSISRAGYPFQGMHGWLIGAILLMTAVWIFHPNSHPVAGMAQIFFQCMIAAPAFWAILVIQNQNHLKRLLVLTFITNFASAGVGVLQVYYPDTFNPIEFTTADADLVSRLTYVGPDGREILRPCGLTDTPGGASNAGLFSGFLGLALLITPGFSWWARILFLFGGALGPMVLLLTHVRSTFLVMAGIGLTFAGILFLQRRMLQVQVLVGIAVAIGISTFIWATTVGGEGIRKRFDFLTGDANVTELADERGVFHKVTFEQHMGEYPFGAGIGRWGIMAGIFNRQGAAAEEKWKPLYVEVQLTGWLFDGGVLMWLVYPIAILFAMGLIFKACLETREEEISYWFGIAFSLNLATVVMCYAGNPFNTQYGIMFWFFSAAAIGLIFKQRLISQPGGGDWRRFRHRSKKEVTGVS
jgi:hypothetical protein